jgi:hypothetical protein
VPLFYVLVKFPFFSPVFENVVAYVDKGTQIGNHKQKNNKNEIDSVSKKEMNVVKMMTNPVEMRDCRKPIKCNTDYLKIRFSG